MDLNSTPKRLKAKQVTFLKKEFNNVGRRGGGEDSGDSSGSGV